MAPLRDLCCPQSPAQGLTQGRDWKTSPSVPQPWFRAWSPGNQCFSLHFPHEGARGLLLPPQKWCHSGQGKTGKEKPSWVTGSTWNLPGDAECLGLVSAFFGLVFFCFALQVLKSQGRGHCRVKLCVLSGILAALKGWGLFLLLCAWFLGREHLGVDVPQAWCQGGAETGKLRWCQEWDLMG